MLGKTSVRALAYEDIWFDGRCRNPWNTEQGSSRSSGSSGTAAGLMAFSLDRVRFHVSPCRWGLARPTFGRVSKAGADLAGARRSDDHATTTAVPVLEAVNGVDAGSSSVGVVRVDPASRSRDSGWLNPAWFEQAGPAERAVVDHLRSEVPAGRSFDLPYSTFVSRSMEAAAAFESLTRSDRDDELVAGTAGLAEHVPTELVHPGGRGGAE